MKTTTHTPIVVVADVHAIEGKSIRLFSCHSPAHALELQRRLGDWRRRSVKFDDWQTAIYDGIDDAKSGIMRDFGIAWFNRARAAIAKARGEG